MNVPRPWQLLNNMVLKVLYKPKAGEPILLKPLSYRQYASETAMLSMDEPVEVDSELDDLTEALAGAADLVEESGNELTGLKNSLVCMHDVLKAYEEHHLEVPERLTAIRRHLEQRRNAIAPHP